MVCSAAVRSAAMSAGRSVRFEPTSATVDADEANPMRRPDAAPDRFGGPCADYFSVKIIQLSCNAKFICAPPGREC